METEFLSPDGRYKVVLSPIPMRMSHEIDSPSLIDNRSGHVIFDPGNLWEGGGVRWSDDSSTLYMNMRQYPDGHLGFEITVEPLADKAVLTHGEKTIFSGTMKQVGQQMSVSKSSGVLIKQAT